MSRWGMLAWSAVLLAAIPVTAAVSMALTPLVVPITVGVIAYDRWRAGEPAREARRRSKSLPKATARITAGDE